MAIGNPWPSVPRLCFVPNLPRSVGLGPLFFPTERRLAQRSIDTQPFPVEPFEEIKELEAFHPQVAVDVRRLPLPKVIVDGARRPIRLAGQGMPLNPGAQHVED